MISRLRGDGLPILAKGLVRVAGFDPTASCVQGRRSSGLSYTLWE
jgi:hypothetical protein